MSSRLGRARRIVCAVALLATTALGASRPAAAPRTAQPTAAVVVEPTPAPPASASPEAAPAGPQPVTLPATQPASAPAVAIQDQPLEDPSGHALDRFYGRLLRLRLGEQLTARVTHWGDSHVTPDVLTQRVRELLQAELGDAGPGFALLGRPWRSYRHGAAKTGSQGRFRAERQWSRYGRRRPRPRDDHFGLAGISVHAPARALAWVEPRRGVFGALDIYFLRKPGAGRIDVRAGGKLIRRVLTMGSEVEPGFALVELPPLTRRVELWLAGGEVRLFGVDLIRSDAGVVYDALGLNGARAEGMLGWNETALAQQLQRAGTQLAILAYGSNEIDGQTLTRERFAQGFDEVLARLHRVAPQVDCLVVGAPDQARFDRASGWTLPAKLDFVVAEQRRLAARHGCAFWDQRAAMGGPGSIFRLAQADPPLARRDHVHFSARGYRELGESLGRALLSGFRAYREEQPVVGGSGTRQRGDRLPAR